MRVFLLGILISITALCIAQNEAEAQQRDAGLWAAFSVKHDWSKKWRSKIEWENRFANNVNELETSFIDLSSRYEFNKVFDVSLNYRFGNRIREDNSYYYRQRWALDLSTNLEIGKVDLEYRARFQSNLENSIASDEGIEFDNGWRNKLSADRKIFKRTRIEGSGEIFLSEDEEGWLLSDIRWTLGLEYKVKKRNYLTVVYLYQTELQEADPLSEYIIRIKYSLEIK